MYPSNDSRLLIVTYHYIRPKSQYPYPGIHPVEKQFFSKQVKWLKERFHMAAPDEVEDFFSGRNPLPGPSIFLTFDDGLIEHEMAAREILDPLGIKAAFFIPTLPLTEKRALMVHKIHWLRATTEPGLFNKQFVELLPDDWRHQADDNEISPEALKIYIYDTVQDARLKYMINFQLPAEIVDSIASEIFKMQQVSEEIFCRETYMSERRIRKLSARGHVIGCHGHIHKPFSKLSGTGLSTDLEKNVSAIEKITAVKPRWVSYPYGPRWSVPENMNEIFNRFGLKIGFCLDKQRMRWNTGDEPRQLIDRINTNNVEEMI